MSSYSKGYGLYGPRFFAMSIFFEISCGFFIFRTHLEGNHPLSPSLIRTPFSQPANKQIWNVVLLVCNGVTMMQVPGHNTSVLFTSASDSLHVHIYLVVGRSPASRLQHSNFPTDIYMARIYIHERYCITFEGNHP